VNRDDTNAPKIKMFLTARQKGVVFPCRVIWPSASPFPGQRTRCSKRLTVLFCSLKYDEYMRLNCIESLHYGRKFFARNIGALLIKIDKYFH
jgi:hypothetical protein